MIPQQWLDSPTTLTEIEESFAFKWLSDVWWDQWRALVNQFCSSDEHWEYSRFEEGPAGEVYEYRTGYALVRGGDVINFIELPDH